MIRAEAEYRSQSGRLSRTSDVDRQSGHLSFVPFTITIIIVFATVRSNHSTWLSQDLVQRLLGLS